MSVAPLSASSGRSSPAAAAAASNILKTLLAMRLSTIA
jgi:hypothetical protein